MSRLSALLIFILYTSLIKSFSCFVYLSMPILIAQTHIQFLIYTARFRDYVMLWPYKTSSSNWMSISCGLCNATPAFSPDLLSCTNTMWKRWVAPFAYFGPDVGLLESDPVDRKTYVILLCELDVSLLGGIRVLGNFLVLNKVIYYHTVQTFGLGKILKEVEIRKENNFILDKILTANVWV